MQGTLIVKTPYGRLTRGVEVDHREIDDFIRREAEQQAAPLSLGDLVRVELLIGQNCYTAIAESSGLMEVAV